MTGTFPVSTLGHLYGNSRIKNNKKGEKRIWQEKE
nr:MAG TPA: hypothetical protein [Caudoviricetes sp.]